MERCDNPKCNALIPDGGGHNLGHVVYCHACYAQLGSLSEAEQIIKAFWDRHPNALSEESSCSDCRRPETCRLPQICAYKDKRYLERTDPDYLASLGDLKTRLAGRLGG